MPPTDNAGSAEITNDLEATVFYVVITNTISLNSLVEKHNGARKSRKYKNGAE